MKTFEWVGGEGHPFPVGGRKIKKMKGHPSFEELFDGGAPTEKGGPPKYRVYKKKEVGGVSSLKKKGKTSNNF